MVATILTGLLLTIPLQTDEAFPRELRRIYEESYGAGREAVGELDGKVLVVRMYADWENEPDKFEPLSIRLKGNRATIEPNEASIPPVAVVTAEDQKDEAVKKAVGDHIGAWTVGKELSLRLPFPRLPAPGRQQWQFIDALGEPLAGAAVEIWLAEHRGPRIRVGRTTLDDTGRLAWKTLAGNLRMAYFTVSHPDYGCAETGQYLGLEDKVIVPLVRRGTVAAQRAIGGRVVDPNGVPVAGATINCPHVRTLGEGLVDGLNNVGQGLTDANGVFSFYLPNLKMRDDRGELIPPKSQYYVRITAPPALGLLPYTEPIENGRDALIVLERGDRLRQLRFEDPNGPITDPARLQNITVLLRRPGRSVLMLHYDDWKTGIRLPVGTYEASMQILPGECQFEPVEVTRASPPEVVFRLLPAVTYYGRVVHGLTGQPMSGAFVLAMSANCSDLRLNDLTFQQWDALYRLARNPPNDDVALQPLRQVYAFAKLVRTDPTGSYGLALRPDETFYGFVVFEQDYLAVMHRKHALQADAEHFAEVPTIKLFPAATVFVEAAVAKEHPSIMPKWEIDEQPRPAWVQELLAIDSNPESSLEYSDWLKSGVRQPVHVPAGVNLRLKLEMPYDEEFCPILIPQPIYLRQGQTVDLGCFTFEPALAVQVKVVDATGQTLEGIPVRTVKVRPEGSFWNVTHNTDEHGLARFHVPPHSTGSFGVLYHDDSGVSLKETMDYQVGGPEDAGREFVFQLSAEMLGHLLR